MFPFVRSGLLMIPALMALAAPASAYDNTIRIRVSPERHWQCGDTFFATGGAERYRHAKVFVGSTLVGAFDFAAPADCAKVIEHVVDLPDGGKATVVAEVGGNRMGADINARDRNRIWTVGLFVDHANGELTQDYAPARSAAAPAPTASPVGQWRNIIDLKIAEARQGQCGDRFFATGGSATYQHARLSIDGQEVARFDFARDADCKRVETVTRMLPDGGKVVVLLEVGPYKMSADISGRDRDRRYAVQFFLDQIWGEVTEGGR